MRVFHFTEQPYPDAWDLGIDSLKVDLPNRHCDPRIASDQYNRFYDEWMLADELGLNIMVNEHHSTATCLSASATIAASILARQTKKARILVLGVPIANRPDPVRVAEELSIADVISRGRIEMGFVKGASYEIPSSNSNPVRMMKRFWEAHDLILKAMSTRDGPFSWESENFHYRSVNIWPRPYQDPHPPVWITGMSPGTARDTARRGHWLGTFLGGYATRKVFDVYRETYRASGFQGSAHSRLSYLGLMATAATESEARRRGDLLLGYIRTISRQQPQYRAPYGYLSVPDHVRLLKGAPYLQLTTKQGAKVPISASVTVDDLIAAGTLFCGTPDQVYRQIVELADAVGGFEQLTIMGQAGHLNHADTVDNLTLFAREVLPRLAEYHPPDVEAVAATAAE